MNTLRYPPRTPLRPEPEPTSDPTRDLYAPIALYGAAFLGLAAWVLLERPGHGLLLFLIAAGALAAIKTAVLVAIAFAVASKYDVEFGTLPTATLKFASIVVCVDTARLWVGVFVRSVGAVSSSGKTVPGTRLFDWLCMLALMGLAMAYLFRFNFEEGRWLIRIMLVAMLVVDIGAVVILRAINETLRSRRTTPVPIATPTPTTPTMPGTAGKPLAPATPATPPAPRIVQTDADRGFDERIISGIGIQDARPWVKYRKDATRKLVDDLVAAGAIHVYVDLGKNRFLVELPATKPERDACLTLANTFVRANGTTTAVGNRYMAIPLPRR